MESIEFAYKPVFNHSTQSSSFWVHRTQPRIHAREYGLGSSWRMIGVTILFAAWVCVGKVLCSIRIPRVFQMGGLEDMKSFFTR